jgi:hypothetical protein
MARMTTKLTYILDPDVLTLTSDVISARISYAWLTPTIPATSLVLA